MDPGWQIIFLNGGKMPEVRLVLCEDLEAYQRIAHCADQGLVPLLDDGSKPKGIPEHIRSIPADEVALDHRSQSASVPMDSMSLW